MTNKEKPWQSSFSFERPKEELNRMFTPELQTMVRCIVTNHVKKFDGSSKFDFDELLSCVSVNVSKALANYEYGHNVKLSTWIYTKTVFAIKDYLRTLSTLTHKERVAGKEEYKVMTYDPHSVLMMKASDSYSFIEEQDTNDRLNNLRRVLVLLSEEDREIIDKLYFVERHIYRGEVKGVKQYDITYGMSKAELAEELGVTIREANRRISMALNSCRSLLETIIE